MTFVHPFRVGSAGAPGFQRCSKLSLRPDGCVLSQAQQIIQGAQHIRVSWGTPGDTQQAAPRCHQPGAEAAAALLQNNGQSRISLSER